MNAAPPDRNTTTETPEDTEAMRHEMTKQNRPAATGTVATTNRHQISQNNKTMNATTVKTRTTNPMFAKSADAKFTPDSRTPAAKERERVSPTGRASRPPTAAGSGPTTRAGRGPSGTPPDATKARRPSTCKA